MKLREGCREGEARLVAPGLPPGQRLLASCHLAVCGRGGCRPCWALSALRSATGLLSSCRPLPAQVSPDGLLLQSSTVVSPERMAGCWPGCHARSSHVRCSLACVCLAAGRLNEGHVSQRPLTACSSPHRRTACPSALRAGRRGWCPAPTLNSQNGCRCRSLRTSRWAGARRLGKSLLFGALLVQPAVAGRCWPVRGRQGQCLHRHGKSLPVPLPCCTLTAPMSCQVPLLAPPSALQPEEVGEEHRRDGFEAASADKIFESTTLAGEQPQ